MNNKTFPQIKVINGVTYYFDSYFNLYMKDFEYSSENYVCINCLRAGQVTKGNHRYDSLVLCNEHNKPMIDILSKLNNIFNNCVGVTRVSDLGLGH